MFASTGKASKNMHRRDIAGDSGGSPGLRASVRLGLVVGALSAAWILGMPVAYSQTSPSGVLVYRHKHIHEYHHVDPSSLSGVQAYRYKHFHKHHHVNPPSQTGTSQGSSVGSGPTTPGGSGNSANTNTGTPPVLTTSLTPSGTSNSPAGTNTSSPSTGTSNPMTDDGSDLSLVQTGLGNGSLGSSDNDGITVSGDVPTPVPEPASLAAFGTALALFFGLGAVRRQRG
jgi:hypothetical protein